MKTTWLVLICSLATILLSAPRTIAQTNGVTYQGRLFRNELQFEPESLVVFISQDRNDQFCFSAVRWSTLLMRATS